MTYDAEGNAISRTAYAGTIDAFPANAPPNAGAVQTASPRIAWTACVGIRTVNANT